MSPEQLDAMFRRLQWLGRNDPFLNLVSHVLAELRAEKHGLEVRLKEKEHALAVRGAEESTR